MKAPIIRTRSTAPPMEMTMTLAASCAPVKHLALLVILSLGTPLPTWAQVKLTQGPEQIRSIRSA